MAKTFDEIQQIYKNRGLVIAEVIKRDNNQFAVLYEVLADTKKKGDAQLLLDMYKELDLEVVMIDTFAPDTVACHFIAGELYVDNMEPQDVAACFRTVFNLDRKPELLSGVEDFPYN